MVNEETLKSTSKELEYKYGLSHYELLQRYMFERILERISVSKYQNNFILKGGLLLSAIFGIDNRTTKDMDTSIRGIDVSQENMIKVLNEILEIKLDDGVKFDIVRITDIRKEDDYGGNKYHIVGRKNNTKVNLEVDISTGDEITPKEIKFKYNLLFEDRAIMISSYNIETILSEKIETILKKGKYNSRMKDFYDIYLLLTKLKDKIQLDVLKTAILKTFTKRKSLKYLEDYKEIVESIKNYERINNLWIIYKRKKEYIDDVELKKILKLLEKFIEELNWKEVYV